jgi:hypothetical protein
MGLPGPDKGKGGRHVMLPPGYAGEIPDGYFGGRSTTYRVLGDHFPSAVDTAAVAGVGRPPSAPGGRLLSEDARQQLGTRNGQDRR